MFPDFQVPIFVILTLVVPERRRTVNLTNRADRFPPMPPRSLVGFHTLVIEMLG